MAVWRQSQCLVTRERTGPDWESSGAADLLILGVGYETPLVREVARAKESAMKVQILGLPPLQLDFYQDNVLRASKAAEDLGDAAMGEPVFAPASDPFVTASVLSEVARKRAYHSLYLSPLATKAQALGFSLFYLYECEERPVSIIYPYRDRQAKASGEGTGRIWRYEVEFPSPER